MTFVRLHITLIFILTSLLLSPAIVVAQNKPVSIQSNGNPLKLKTPSKESLARSYYYRGNYEKAAQLYGELYNKEKRYSYYTYYFNSLIYLKKYKEAEKLSKKQIRISSQNVRYSIDLAYVYSLEGLNKKSNRIINKLVDNLPNNRNLIINTANILLSKGFSDAALRVYEKARKNSLGNYRYNMEIATAYRYTGNYGKMFDALIAQLDENPNDLKRVENNIQNLLVMDVDNNLSKTFKEKILIKAQADPENMQYAELLMWYSLQTKDFSLALRQAKSIDRRYRGQEEAVYKVADIAYSNDNYKIASEGFEYLIRKKADNPYYVDSYDGYFSSKIKLAKENPENNSSRWIELDKIGSRAIDKLGINRSTTNIVKNLADIKAFKLNQNTEAINLLNKAIDIPMKPESKAVLKMELADILAFTGKFWDASLLYSQVEHDLGNNPLGYEAKFRNARIFYYKGEFDWAKTRLDILKGATSKFIANDALELSLFIKDMLEEDTLGFTLRLFAAADQYIFQHKPDSALIFLSKIEDNTINTTGSEFKLYKEASVYEQEKKYHIADSLYTMLYTQFPESIKADNALFYSAEINRKHFSDFEKASSLYLKLMKDYPESIFSTQSRTLYRKLNEKKQ